jgi:ribosomal protein L11 methylase PrmA
MAGRAVARGGSFRDPAGVVFERDGVLLRQVNRSYEPHYRRLMDSGLYEALVADGRLVAHQEVAEPALDPGPAALVIRPERVPFVSYPYEWCFGQWKDAALLTLAAQREAIGRGLTLKDASAYNVQWLRGKPVLIDTLSFEVLDPTRPWAAYRQFCQHFLAPLALMSRVDVRLGQLLRVHLDGVPLDLASRLLPVSTRLRPGLMVHLHMHATAQRSSARKQDASRSGGAPPARGFSEAALRGLIDHLESTVKALAHEPGGTTWDGYYEKTNYTTEAFEAKKALVGEWLGQARPANVWDLGANDGTFSRLAADQGAQVVSFDFDPSCVERNYRRERESGDGRVLPLLLDLTNPSPALGWMCEERESWPDRGPADLVLALAVVHHLALGNNVPLPRVADGLARCSRAWLLVEFVPREDSQAARLLAGREETFPDYTEAHFLAALGRSFEPVKSAGLPGGRSLHLLRKGGDR